MTTLHASSLALGGRQHGIAVAVRYSPHAFPRHLSLAGQLRSVNIYQKDINFCHFAYLETEGNAVMQRLEEEDYLRDLPFEPFCDQLKVFYVDINMLHPLREGNGRAQRIFFEQLIIHAGYDIHWRPLDRQDWRRANEVGAFGDPAPLAALFKRAVSKPGDDV